MKCPKCGSSNTIPNLHYPNMMSCPKCEISFIYIRGDAKVNEFMNSLPPSLKSHVKVQEIDTCPSIEFIKDTKEFKETSDKINEILKNSPSLVAELQSIDNYDDLLKFDKKIREKVNKTEIFDELKLGEPSK